MDDLHQIGSVCDLLAVNLEEPRPKRIGHRPLPLSEMRGIHRSDQSESFVHLNLLTCLWDDNSLVLQQPVQQPQNVWRCQIDLVEQDPFTGPDRRDEGPFDEPKHFS